MKIEMCLKALKNPPNTWGEIITQIVQYNIDKRRFYEDDDEYFTNKMIIIYSISTSFLFLFPRKYYVL